MRAAHVIGMGALTSVGLTFPTTVGAVRCTTSRFRAHESLRDLATGEPIVLALADSIPRGITSGDRMIRSATASAVQALSPILARVPELGAALTAIVALPMPRPGFTQEESDRVAQHFLRGLPCEVDERTSAIVRGAHTAGLAALAVALEAIRSGTADVALVGGADSYADIDTLHWIEAQGRLKTIERPFGMVPGEGSAFLLLSSDSYVARHGLRSLGEIVSVAQDTEPDPWYTRRPCLAQGLTRAILGVLEATDTPARQAAVTYADLNGESFRADEWTLAYVRTGHRQSHPLDLRHPASSWGDVGVATGTLLVGTACLDLHHGKSSGSTALVCTSADVLPHRAACFLRRSAATSEAP